MTYNAINTRFLSQNINTSVKPETGNPSSQMKPFLGYVK